MVELSVYGGNIETMEHWVNQKCLKCYFPSSFTILLVVWGKKQSISEQI